MFSTSDTIAAIATAAGRGAIGVVRISGPEAHAIGRAVLGREAPLDARYATFARLPPSTESAGVGDHVIATFFPAPHSYTTENTIEISAHGSPVVLASILDSCVRNGARIAAPGEFTFRAYIHGRIELTQAEAVADLVDSVTPLQARAAFDQLEGSLATAICGVSEALLDLTAQLEASLDFPEEGFHFADPARVRGEVERVRGAVQDLLATANEGRAIREGRRVVIAGPPNAGKSSLFNRLAGMDRAIVSATPGTTRDLLIEQIALGGVPVTLVDTAGLREADSDVEAEGVRRAEQAAGTADLTVVVLDRSEPLGNDQRIVLQRAERGRRLIVANKSDLPPAWMPAEAGVDVACVTSARTGAGLSELRAALLELLGRDHGDGDVPRITNVRHVSLLRRVNEELSVVLNDLQAGAPEEVVVDGLVAARASVEEISGLRTPEDVLNHIFSRFCIGK